MKRTVTLLILTLTLAGVLACSLFIPEATPTSTPDVELSQNTAVPAPTNTPQPTPAPVGYYLNESARFSLILPNTWEVMEEYGGSGTYFGYKDDFVLFLSLTDVDENASLDAWSEEIETELNVSFDTVNRNEVELANQQIAERIEAHFDYVEGGETYQMAAYLLHTSDGLRFHNMFIWGLEEPFYAQQDTIEEMLASYEIITGKVYGLDRNDTLVLLGGGDPLPEDMDPAQMTSSAASWVGHIYSGLVRLSPQSIVEPDLAESWKISSDGLIYTFTLREGLKFSNGDPITAEDVKYSLERAADPETNSPTAGTYLADILGMQARIDGDADEIEGVVVLDERTIQITLDGPKPYFLAKLTYPASYIVDQNNVESGDEWMFNPNASGPYKIKEFISEDAMIFERNENYYAQAEINNIVYLLYRGGTSLSYYKAAEIDLTQLNSATALEIIENADDPLNNELLSTPNMCTSYIALNNTRPPFDDPKVREAFALSINPQKLIDQFQDGLGSVAESLLPPGMPGYNAASNFPDTNIDAAKSALAESSYANNLPEVIVNIGGYADQESAYNNAVIQMWRDVLNVDVTIEYTDPEDVTRGLREADGHIAFYGWCADYPDPENFLDILYHTDSEFNIVNYSNPDYDSLIEEARTATDVAERIALYQKAEALLLSDFGIIPLSNSLSYTVIKPYIKGYIDSPMGAPIVHLLWFEGR